MQHKGRIGLARVVKEIQEMHRHHRFADSNRQAHELGEVVPLLTSSGSTRKNSRRIPTWLSAICRSSSRW